MRRILLFLLLLFPTIIFAQEIKERRVYYLDCSQSMSGIGDGAVDIWDTVIGNLIDAINGAPKSDAIELVVVPFAVDTEYKNDNLKGCSQRSTDIGKRKMIDYIKSIQKPGKKDTKTYHKNAINDFLHNRANSADKTYMFLLTDGGDEEPKYHNKETFNNELEKWNQHFKGKKVYAFYIMLNKEFAKTEDYKKREALIKKVPYFWSIETANVNVNTISPASIDTLDLRRKGARVKIKFDGNIEGLDLKVKTDNQLKQTQDAKCISKDTLEVYLEANVDCDVFSETLSKHLTIFMPNADSEGVFINNNIYTILVENSIDMPCVCQPGNNVTITNENHSNWSWDENIIPIKTTDLLLDPNKQLGTIKYYTKSIFYPKDRIIQAQNTFTFTYNKKAQENDSYAKLRFVTKDSCLNNTNFKIFINKKELVDKTILVKNPQAIECSFWMSSDVPEGEYTIELEILDNDLMYFNDKNIQDNKIVQTWTIKHKKICNPFWIWFLRLLILLVILIFLIYSAFVIRQFCAPKFPKPRVRLGFEPRPLNIPPGNIEIYHKDRDPDNNINLCSLHRKYIRRIILQANENEITKYKPLKIIFNWLNRKWNGETIILRTNFEGRDITQIVITPIKTNEEIKVTVISPTHQYNYKIDMKWSREDSTAIIPSEEIKIADTNLIFYLYNGEKLEEVKLDSSKNFISKNIIKYYNSITKKH